jgi:hypothetical protein
MAKEPRVGCRGEYAGQPLPELRLPYFLANGLGIANRAASIGTFA